jgi:hypothetical protein
MADIDQPLTNLGTRHDDPDPVLTLLAEISAGLKDLNVIFKDHATRLARSEDRSQCIPRSAGEDDIEADHGNPKPTGGDGESMQAESAESEPEWDMNARDKDGEPSTVGETQSPSKVLKSVEVKHGCFPPTEAYGHGPNGSFQMNEPLWDNEQFLSWLKEKSLIFADDGRYEFSFDLVNLARNNFGLDRLEEAKSRVGQMEQFDRDIRKSGGFFFFRESDLQGGNKIYNGSDVFTLTDNQTLPFHLMGLGDWGRKASLGSLEFGKSIVSDVNPVLYGPRKVFSEPSTTYRLKEEPGTFTPGQRRNNGGSS